MVYENIISDRFYIIRANIAFFLLLNKFFCGKIAL